METKNHWDLARRLLEEEWLEAGALGRLLFKLGSVYPDINVLTYFRGHTYRGAQRYIARNLAYLQGRKTLSAWDYWRLGALLHYVADIFTACHNESYACGLREHQRYEKHLRGCFRAHLHRLPPLRLMLRPLGRPRLPLRDPLTWLRQKHREYTAQARHPMRDSAYIAAVCRQLAWLAVAPLRRLQTT